MGCIFGTAGSSTVDDFKDGSTIKPSYALIINNKCPHVRLDHNDAPKIMSIEGTSLNYNLKYCYVSQRGYYPNALSKANQDSYVICEQFLHDKNSHFFGIFDGHGEFGDFCSFYAADMVPKYLEKELSSRGGVQAMNGPHMEDTYIAAFVKANKAMHKEQFDDSLSGTTAITVFVQGDILYVANVGDSRAIIATADSNGKNRYSALSIDQTPFRKDERERLKKRGARIMTLDQVEGNETLHENWGNPTGDDIDEVGDPPRVWDHTLERPGCAFTRSLGDAVAETVGVFAVPELLTWKISPDDKFVVIASDGVFEFLTSQAVVEMISEFDDPLDAAKHVVSESYRLWLTYDDRTDDISIIILSFENIVKTGMGTIDSKRQNSANIQAAMAENKPVRRVMSKEKRKVISEAWANDDKEEFDFEKNSSPKTPDELIRIEEMVRANFMFQSLSRQQREQIFMVMKLRTVKEGELIIKEGDQGDVMYIIDSGEFTVLKRDENGINQTVFTYTSPGAAFGELSLMYGKPRAASVRAKTAGRLWSIDRLAFRSVLMKKRQGGLMKTMQTFSFFANVSYPQLQRLCDVSTEETYNNGEIIASVAKNDTTWTMLIVLHGSLSITSMNGGSRGQAMIRGEGSMLGRVEIGQTISEATAVGRTRIARIPTNTFVEVMGEDGRDIFLGMSGTSPRLVRSKSIWSRPENLNVDKLDSRSEYVLDHVMLTLGDFAYVGVFQRSTNSMDKNSIKVIAKGRAVYNKMDEKMWNERSFLVATQGQCKYIPKIKSTLVDAKVAMLVYDDVFVCDLSTAIINDALELDTKKFCVGAIYQAMKHLHINGLLHRFINSNSIYMTSQCVPKLTDFRYAKKMDGLKTFTVCGDPLYFAPEIVSQQGYDYSVDLWAFGILAYEIFESNTPFGTTETEETQLFRLISSYSAGQLNFTAKTFPSARELILALLDPRPSERLGYKSHADVEKLAFFDGLNEALNRGNLGIPDMDIQVAVDSSSVFIEAELDPYNSAAFSQY
jgi:serine/threonine protein phosphatase PrpC/CRP-like cAMP-binding protein